MNSLPSEPLGKPLYPCNNSIFHWFYAEYIRKKCLYSFKVQICLKMDDFLQLLSMGQKLRWYLLLPAHVKTLKSLVLKYSEEMSGAREDFPRGVNKTLELLRTTLLSADNRGSGEPARLSSVPKARVSRGWFWKCKCRWGAQHQWCLGGFVWSAEPLTLLIAQWTICYKEKLRHWQIWFKNWFGRVWIWIWKSFRNF